jgi:hypothetical protein
VECSSSWVTLHITTLKAKAFLHKSSTTIPRFDKLITSLRAVGQNEGILDKEATSYDDVFDAFRLALKFYHFEESSSDD